MNTRLITFLGRAPEGVGRYRTTRYRFSNGDETEPLAFFGWALQRRLRPDDLVILGTSGSMWDHLFEGDVGMGDAYENERLALIAAVADRQVTQTQLDALAPALSKAVGCRVKLVLIPYARAHAEQVAILQSIADHVEVGDRVHLDVTHGFRHLPMLALLSALHLQTAHQATIEGIWYGAFDPDTGDAPVHDLSGLLQIAAGIKALSAFDNDGNYGVFEPILRSAGLAEEGCETLHKAAYYENILNVAAATGELRKAIALMQAADLSPEGRLLRPSILRRLSWLEGNRQFDKQTRLARTALARRDYLRATLYAYEAVITRVCQSMKVPLTNFTQREEAREDFERRLREADAEQWANYKLLKGLRNQVAHGTRGQAGEIQQALLSEPVMHQQLDRLLRLIEDGKLPGSVAG